MPLSRLITQREVRTAVLLALLVLFAGLREPRLLAPSSLESILRYVPLLLLVGLGQMLVIVTRGIDVSVGSIVGCAAMVSGMAFRDHPGLPLWEGTLIGVGTGLLLGGLNGVVISKAKVPPIIATLGTLSAYRGLIFIISRSKQVDSNDLPDGLTKWSLDGPVHVGGVTVPWIFVLALAVSLLMAGFIRYTRAGRDVFALGSHPEAARLRGVPVGRTQFLVYAVTGALSGLAGVLYASRYGFVNPATAGQGMELVAIAAVVVGGTKVTGGSGSVLGVALGSFLLATLNVALAVLGIEANYQLLVYGVVILVALLLDSEVQRSLARRAA